MRLVAALVAVACSTGCRASQSTPGEQSMASPGGAPSPAVPNGPVPGAPVPGAPVPSAPVPDAAPDAAGPRRTGAVLFCAYGGQGVLPTGAKPESYYRVIVLFEVTTPDSAPTEALSLASLSLEDAGGSAVARMRALISAERAARTPLTDAWRSALDDRGPRFDDRYAPGITRVRVEAWLDTRPAAPPARVRVVLAGAGAPVEISGAVAGEWPTG